MALALLHYLSRSSVHRVAVILDLVSFILGMIALTTESWSNADVQSITFPSAKIDFGIFHSYTNGTTSEMTSVSWCTEKPYSLFMDKSHCETFLSMTTATMATLIAAVISNFLAMCIGIYARQWTLLLAFLAMGLYAASVVIYPAGAIPALKDSPSASSKAIFVVSYNYSYVIGVVAAVINCGSCLLVVSSCSFVRREKLGYAGRDKQLADIDAYKAKMTDKYNSLVVKGNSSVSPHPTLSKLSVPGGKVVQGSEQEMQRMVPVQHGGNTTTTTTATAGEVPYGGSERHDSTAPLTQESP
eukprot:PhF_6_TR13546/c1_g1_i1/m.21648